MLLWLIISIWFKHCIILWSMFPKCLIYSYLLTWCQCVLPMIHVIKPSSLLQLNLTSVLRPPHYNGCLFSKSAIDISYLFHLDYERTSIWPKGGPVFFYLIYFPIQHKLALNRIQVMIKFYRCSVFWQNITELHTVLKLLKHANRISVVMGK